jgi:hypothetical protein
MGEVDDPRIEFLEDVNSVRDGGQGLAVRLAMRALDTAGNRSPAAFPQVVTS